MSAIIEDSIVNLLELRAREYDIITKRVFDSFGDCISEAIKQYLLEDSPFKLHDIQTIHGINGFVRITAILSPQLGTSIKVNDKMVEITEQNVNKFKSLTKIVVPIRLIQKKDAKAMAEFAKDLSYILPVASDVDIQKLLTIYNDEQHLKLSDINFYYTLLETKTRPPNVNGFSTGTLTEQQMLSFNLFKECITETLN